MGSNTVEGLLIAREAIEKAIVEERERGASEQLVALVEKAQLELARVHGIQRSILERQIRG